MPDPITSVVEGIGRHPLLSAGIALGGAGALYGFRQGRAENEDPGYVADRAGGMAMAGVTMAAAGGAAWAARRPLKAAFGAAGKGLYSGANHYITGSMGDVAKQKTFAGKVFGRGAVSIGAGALVGGLITAYSEDDPGKGMKYGAAAGAAAFLAYKGKRVWDVAGKIPGGKSALIIAGAAAIAVGGRAMTPDAEPEMEGVAERSYGDYETHTVRERMDMMNASGDIVFGLHNRR